MGGAKYANMCSRRLRKDTETAEAWGLLKRELPRHGDRQGTGTAKDGDDEGDAAMVSMLKTIPLRINACASASGL